MDKLNILSPELSFNMPQNKTVESEIKGLIFDIKKYAIHDGPGIRTTVFFKGCPLQCKWCHNPESWSCKAEQVLFKNRCIACGQCARTCPQQAISIVENLPVTNTEKCSLCGRCVDVCMAGAREIIGQSMTINEVIYEIKKDIIFYDQSGGGVTFSGGEPLMQPEFLLELLNQCKANEIHTAVDTSCYAPVETLKIVSEKTDLFLCDLKHMDNEMHELFTGAGNNLILDNIIHLSAAGKKIVIRVPIIPGFNDNEANINATGKFIASLQNVNTIDILPFSRGGAEKSARLTTDIKFMRVETPNAVQMNSIAKNLSRYGLKVKIGG